MITIGFLVVFQVGLHFMAILRSLVFSCAWRSRDRPLLASCDRYLGAFCRICVSI